MRIYEHGDPEVFHFEEVERLIPRATEVLVLNESISVNFVDTQHRAGLNYPVTLPLIPGVESIGLVNAIGPEVTEFVVGDRVGNAGFMGGVYAEYTPVPEARPVPIPTTVDLQVATDSLLQVMTAHFLVLDAYQVRVGGMILVHAAASGVGLFLIQMAKLHGATVIGTVSTAEKEQGQLLKLVPITSSVTPAQILSQKPCSSQTVKESMPSSTRWAGRPLKKASMY